MLVLGLAVAETIDAAFHHEPTGSARGHGQDGVQIGVAAVADPLLIAGDFVAHHLAVFLHRRGGCPQCAEIAAGIGFGGAVGHQQPLLGDAGHPVLFLLLGGAEDDRVAAQERGQHAGCYPEIDVPHHFADAVHIKRTATHAAKFLRDEKQVDAKTLAAHFAHDFNRKLIFGVELEQFIIGKALFGKFFDCLNGKIQGIFIKSCAHGNLLLIEKIWPYESV